MVVCLLGKWLRCPTEGGADSWPHLSEAGVLGGAGRAGSSRGLPPGFADGRVLPVPAHGHPLRVSVLVSVLAGPQSG